MEGIECSPRPWRPSWIPLGWGEAPALAEGAIQGQVSPDGDGLLAMHGRFIAAMDDDLNTSGALAFS